MKSCELSLIKYILFIFNLIFAISGVGIIIGGALVLSDIEDFRRFTENNLFVAPIVLIVIGSLVFIVAFLGCFGAIREQYKLLIAFAVCLLIIFITEMAIGIAAAVYQNEFDETLKTTLKQSLENYSENKMEQTAWDTAQKKLRCCGVDTPNDWPQIPFSCCHGYEELKHPPSQYCLNYAKGKYSYQSGCYEQVKMKINDNIKVLIGVGIGIAFIEVVGIILALWLAYTIKNNNTNK